MTLLIGCFNPCLVFRILGGDVLLKDSNLLTNFVEMDLKKKSESIKTYFETILERKY